MERSRLLLVSLSGAFMLAGLGLMVVSADDKELYRDLTNAVQHIDEVRFTHTGSNPTDATMKRVTNKEVIGIKAKNFNITQKGENYNRIGANVSSSNILGGSKNKINDGSYNVIIAGSENIVDCGNGVTVLGGENNKARGNYTTILGGKDNTVYGCDSNNSVIVGGSNNGLKGLDSVVVGMNNNVTGNQSVSMGENSKVKASNSFLWTDGNQNGVLEAGNVFAVAGDNGMVVNTDQAHSFAKLTIGGSLVLYGDNHGNFEGLGGGKIKVVNGDSNQKCFCSYDSDKWNSLFGKGRCNYYCNKELSSLEEPECGTQVYKICTNGMGERNYYYSGTCEKGKVVEGTGAYILDKENKIHWSCQIDDGKIKKCVGDVSVSGTCGETSKCTGELPKFAELNNPIAVADGGQYHPAQTTDQSACAYHCKANFHLAGNDCVGDPRTIACISSELPTYAEWVNGNFQQQWNGKYWYPIVKKGTHNPAGSVECSFKCKENYTWDGVRCVANSQQINCTGNPTNSLWVSGTFKQIWGGNMWKPTLPSAKHISNNSIDCYFRCDSAHVRNGSNCSCPATAGLAQSCCKETTCTAGTFCSNSGKCEECTNYNGICRKSGVEGICQLINGAGQCVGVEPTNVCPTGRRNLAYGTECCTNEDSCHHTTEMSNGKVIESGCMPTSSSSLGGICGECFVDADCMNKGYGPDKTKCENYECISVPPVGCTIPTAGFGEACCNTTLCLDSVGDSGAPQRFCSNREICEECTNYGGRCNRKDGKGLCIRATDSSAGECVACFEDNQSFQQGTCVTARCGSSAGIAFTSTPSNNLCAVGNATPVQLSNGKYTWQCKIGDTNHGISQVSCEACKQAECGEANGRVFSSNPNYGLCNVGEAREVQSNGGSYTWKCVSCNSTVSCGGSVSAACGNANGKTYSNRPLDSELCNLGSKNNPRIEGFQYKWFCVNGGSIGSCNAFQTAKCGSSNGQIFSSKPSNNLCGIGTASEVGDNGTSYTWSCTNGDSTVQCSATVEAKCGSSNGQTFGEKPTTNLCEKGNPSTVSDNGTSYTWSCTNGSSVKSCSATNGCNIATAGNGEACCSTANGDSMNTVCRPDKTVNNDYKCFNSHKVCEECDNYGGRCSRPYYTQNNLGQGLCIKHENSGKPFGECVACFSPYETFDMDTGKCGYVDCGDTEGSCKYCTTDGCSNFTASSSNGSWTCSKGNASVNGRSSKTCTLPDPEPTLNSDITMEWIDYYDYHGDKHQKNSIDKLPINVVAELAFFKNGNYISDGNTVIGKYGSTNIKLNDITWSTPDVSSYSSDVNSNGNVSKYWMTLKDASVVPRQGTTTVYFEGKYNGKTLISESVTEWFYKAEASCKVDNGNILGKWFNASGKICSA